MKARHELERVLIEQELLDMACVLHAGRHECGGHFVAAAPAYSVFWRRSIPSFKIRGSKNGCNGKVY
jgi:hypothetical protein